MIDRETYLDEDRPLTPLELAYEETVQVEMRGDRTGIIRFGFWFMSWRLLRNLRRGHSFPTSEARAMRDWRRLGLALATVVGGVAGLATAILVVFLLQVIGAVL